MKHLTNEEIIRNNIETVNQYKVLQYLKSNLNIYEFDLFLYDNNTIKVIDKNNDIGYFRYQKENNNVLFFEEDNEITYEMNLEI